VGSMSTPFMRTVGEPRNPCCFACSSLVIFVFLTVMVRLSSFLIWLMVFAVSFQKGQAYV